MSESELTGLAQPTKVMPRPKRDRDAKGRLLPKDAASTSPMADRQSEATPEATETQDELGPRPEGSLGIRQSRLRAPKRDGYHRRFINDWPGRIAEARTYGWSHVDENGKPWARNVGTQHGGGVLQSYLMEIPIPWYNATQKEKQIPLDDVDDQIYRGTHKADDSDNRYVPKDGAGQPIIKFNVQRGTGQ